MSDDVLLLLHLWYDDLVSVVQKVDSTIQQVNLDPLDRAIGFPNIYPLELLNNWGL